VRQRYHLIGHSIRPGSDDLMVIRRGEFEPVGSSQLPRKLRRFPWPSAPIRALPWTRSGRKRPIARHVRRCSAAREPRQVDYARLSILAKSPPFVEVSSVIARPKCPATVAIRRTRSSVVLLGDLVLHPGRDSCVLVRKTWVCRDARGSGKGRNSLPEMHSLTVLTVKRLTVVVCRCSVTGQRILPLLCGGRGELNASGLRPVHCIGRGHDFL